MSAFETALLGKKPWRTRSFTTDLSSKQKIVVTLTIVAVVIIYFTSAPSAAWIYEYTAAKYIAETIVTAPIYGVTRPLCELTTDVTNYINLDPDEVTLAELSSANFSDEALVLVGGAWRPTQCTSRHRVAIVVPYRNRQRQLEIFVNHMHRFLRQQLIDYRIVIVEQNDSHPFNRAQLLNIGFVESLKLYDFHCFIFHDVDLLPEVLANMYACSNSPRHMTVAINTMRYNLPYKSIFGGVTAMTVDQFRLVNGYSNYFFGWGGEDDDLSNRIAQNGMKTMRWDPKISRYYMMFHLKETPNPNRYALLRRASLRYEYDGLSNLTYKLMKLEELKLYTLVSVHLKYQ